MPAGKRKQRDPVSSKFYAPAKLIPGFDLMYSALIRRAVLDLNGNDPLLALDALLFFCASDDIDLISGTLNREYLLKESCKYDKK